MTDAKRMEVHEALDEVRAQKERLEEEFRSKESLYNTLRKAHNELVTKFQEAKLQSEKQAGELSAKTEELTTLCHLHQDLKSSFHEKESSLKHLNSANEKLRFDYGEIIKKLEGENKEIVSALNESTTTIQDLKSKICAGNKESEDLKKILLLKDQKLLEMAEKVRVTKNLVDKDDVIHKLEEEHRDLQDQLKWKNEKFQHLKEAHERLQDKFRLSEAEWEREKSVLLEDFNSLQTSLDSQIRISESLRTQLSMCNQALVHEESTRKVLEVELSEYKLRFEDVFSEYCEAKAEIEKLSFKRNEEVARLRDSLATKDSIFKEMEYKMAYLEQENCDIKASLKELQEDRIMSNGTTGNLKKLQKKLRSLDQTHQKCAEEFKVKETEWKSQIEKITNDMNCYVSKLKVQSEQAQKLHEELEFLHCLSEVRDEEISIVVLVLKSEFSVAYSQLFNAVSELELRKQESEDMILHLKEQLGTKSNDFHTGNVKISQKQDAKDGISAFELVETELVNKVLELEKGKSMAENQIIHLEASLEACKTENENLQHTVKDQNEIISNLQEQFVLVTERTKAIEALEQEKENNFQIIEENKRKLENLVIVSEEEKKRLLQVIEERDQMMEDFEERAKEYEQKFIDAHTSSKEKQIEIDVLRKALHEAQNKPKLEIKKKNDKIVKMEIEVSDLCKKLKVKDDKIVKMETAISDLCKKLKVNDDKIVKMEIEVSDLCKKLKVKDDEIVKMEIEVSDLCKNLKVKDDKIVKMEIEVSDLCKKLKVKDESLFQSYQHAKQLEILLEKAKGETENMTNQFENEKKNFESVAEKLKVQKEALLEDIKTLLSDREELLMQMEKVCEQIGEFSFRDVQLMGMLENIMQNSEDGNRIVNLSYSPSQKNKEAAIDERWPLVELNK